MSKYLMIFATILAAASFIEAYPQSLESEAKQPEGIEINPENFEVIEPAGEAATDVCDFTACNGLTIAAEVGNKSFTIGECQSAISEEATDYECFVNEDSICPKTPTESPGVFTSTEPCEDPRAPRPRFAWISNPWYPIWTPRIFTHPFPIVPIVVQPVNQTILQPVIKVVQSVVNAGTGCQNVFGSVVPCAG